MSENNFKKLLYKFLDSRLTEVERIYFVESLKNNPDHGMLQKEMSSIRKKIKTFGKQAFSDGFEMSLQRKSNQYFIENTSQLIVPDVISAVFGKVCLSAALILVLISIYNVKVGNNNLLKNIFSKSIPNMEYVFDPTSKTNLVNSK
jgi:hypothetical protein